MIATVTLNPAIDQTIMIDHFQAGLVNTVNTVTETAGGKGINVARVLADLNNKVTATGLMGKINCSFFHDYLTQHGVNDQFIILEGNVRTNIKVASAHDGSVTDINLPGFTVSDESLSQVVKFIKTLPERIWIAVCGSLPPGLSADAFQQFLLEIKRAGFRLAIDTSGEALKYAIATEPDLIKPNIHELSELAGQHLSHHDALLFAEEQLNQGVKDIILSCGAEGAWLLNKEQKLYVQPGKVQVVSTVGAGDSMLAGFLHGTEQMLEPVQRAKLATACGMSAVSQAGVGGFTIAHLRELMKGIECKFTH